MKRKFLNVISFCMAFVFLPVFSAIPVKKSEKISLVSIPEFNIQFDGTEPIYEENSPSLPEHYKILDVKTGEVLNLTPEEYIIGVVCAEMPASFEEEALKAQAVAAHTYALRQMGIALKNEDESLQGAFLSTDSAKFQAYLSKEERKSLYGNNFENYEDKISRCVLAVINEILLYQDEPIVAAFHSISSGKTESSKDIWGKALPYLVSVESKSDSQNPKGQTEITLSKQEAKKILKTEASKNLIKIISRTKSGTVLEAKTQDETLSGDDIRALFNLPSANFSVKETADSVIFTCYGYGHGVGMSQYGANDMAKEEKNYKQILSHYYPNATLKTI